MNSRAIKIAPLPVPRLISLSFSGKRRNKDLLERLAAFNRDMATPDFIASALDITREELDFLARLGTVTDGWQPAEYSAEGLPRRNAEHLACLGLIRLKWPGHKIALTDAGRFLLVLEQAEPPPLEGNNT